MVIGDFVQVAFPDKYHSEVPLESTSPVIAFTTRNYSFGSTRNVIGSALKLSLHQRTV